VRSLILRGSERPAPSHFRFEDWRSGVTVGGVRLGNVRSDGPCGSTGGWKPGRHLRSFRTCYIKEWDRPRGVTSPSAPILGTPWRPPRPGSSLHSFDRTSIAGDQPHGLLSPFFGAGTGPEHRNTDANLCATYSGNRRFAIACLESSDWALGARARLLIEMFCEEEREASGRGGSLGFVEHCCSVVVVLETAA
jgi:hypothetical protein